MSDLSGKKTLRLSSISQFRCKEPTNKGTANKFTNMVFDHSNQLRIFPRGFHAVNRRFENLTTINRRGEPKALDVFIGGSPDYRGKPYSRSIKPKKTYY